MSRNDLDRETSPYLLQHKDNPVHWRAWGPAAFAAAKAENKAILLSVGYAACHWCHVMAHESFENSEIAAVMNELFVPVKVDREERPDVDAIYQSALALMGQQGGWPLTMFLSPEGKPFWGGTYFPDQARYGRPGFVQILHRVHQVFHEQPDDIAKNQASLMAGLNKLWSPNPDDAPLQLGLNIPDQVAEHLLKKMDLRHGGMAGAPKFPHTSLLELLWRRYLRAGDTAMAEAVELSLERMAEGGIYDHLGGGYSRYATDERWLAPHFEKMLYDNAQLIDVNFRVWCANKSELLRRRCHETVDWLLREMLAEGGGFAASLDADSEGVEGKFYVWDEAEIDRLLGTEAAFFKQVYDVSGPGNWEETNILNRLDGAAVLTSADEARLGTARDILFRERAERIRPGWDDKVLADWNGLTIHALVRAGAAFEMENWIKVAKTAFDFVRAAMVDDGKDANRLMHSHRQGRNTAIGMLDDYAAMARAGLALYEITGDVSCLQAARGWVAVLQKHFLDPESGGYFFTADDAENLIVRQRSAADNATPSGNGLMVEVLARLYWLTGAETYRDQLESLLDAFSAELGRNFFPLTSYLNGAELYLDPVQVVIVGDRAAADCRALLGSVWQSANLNIILEVITDPATLPGNHPARHLAQATPARGGATAYVCRAMSCSLPITGPGALAGELRPDGLGQAL